MKALWSMVQIASCGLGAALAGFALAACFNAYLDPTLGLALMISSFLCQ